MTTHNFKIDLGHVDLSKLDTDDDFRREARRLLPGVLEKLGEAAGEVAWKELQKGLKRVPGVKLNSSSSDKRSFVRESGQNYRKQASSKEKRELEEEIIQQLREQKRQLA